jgi:hypothetical protein
MRCKRTGLTFALIILALLGCSSPIGYEAGLPQPGVLQLAQNNEVLVPPQVLIAPDTVNAGEAFDVITTTIGMNGCWSASGQSWRTLDHVIEITPHDVYSGAGVCTEILLYLRHTSAVTIEEPGEWLLRVQGRRVRPDRVAFEEAVVVEKSVVVR